MFDSRKTKWHCALVREAPNPRGAGLWPAASAFEPTFRAAPGNSRLVAPAVLSPVFLGCGDAALWVSLITCRPVAGCPLEPKGQRKNNFTSTLVAHALLRAASSLRTPDVSPAFRTEKENELTHSVHRGADHRFLWSALHPALDHVHSSPPFAFPLARDCPRRDESIPPVPQPNGCSDQVTDHKKRWSASHQPRQSLDEPETRLNPNSTTSGVPNLYSTLLRLGVAGVGRSADAAPKSACATFAHRRM
jgi:hypothetical protein